MTNANISELINLQEQYHIMCIKKTIRYGFKTKPELFAHIKDINHTEQIMKRKEIEYKRA